jgi:hypothetical protein
MVLLSGCEQVTRLTGLAGLTDTVPASEPQLVGPELLRVSIPTIEAQATLGPVARQGDVTVWQTLDGTTLSFRGGSLIATRGLGDDLMSADVAGRLEMLRNARGAEESGYYPHIRSYLDGEDRTVFRSYKCRHVPQAHTGADPDGALRRINELCVSPTDRFTNVYWLDRSGTMVRSRQWISPKVQYMETSRVPR